MLPHPYRSIMFDMDGVLLDSRPAMTYAWSCVCDKFKFNIHPQLYLDNIGLPFESILTNLGISESLHVDIKLLYGSSVTKCSHLMTLYRGIPFVLNQLSLLNLSIAIITSKEFWRADYICDVFGIPCEVLITPEFTQRGKPHPDPIIAALSKLDVAPHQSIYIGDMLTDRQSAESANVTFLHASWGYGIDPQSKLKLDYPEELLEFII